MRALPKVNQWTSRSKPKLEGSKTVAIGKLGLGLLVANPPFTSSKSKNSLENI